MCKLILLILRLLASTVTGMLLVTIASPAVVSACLKPPDTIRRDHKALIREANAIVVGHVVKVPSDTTGEYELMLDRALKGTSEKHIGIHGRVSKTSNPVTTFNNHQEADFWYDRLGRLEIAPDCTVLFPTFSANDKYVLLLGIRPDTKQFERVSLDNDAWIEFIQQEVAHPWHW